MRGPVGTCRWEATFRPPQRPLPVVVGSPALRLCQLPAPLSVPDAPAVTLVTPVQLAVSARIWSQATWPTAREWHTGYNDNFNEEENT